MSIGRPEKERDISQDTISNWECNRAMPDPEQVAALEKLYECPGLWDSWMRLQWPSYHEHIPEAVKPNTAVEAIARLGIESADVRGMLEPILRDLMDGKIHDQEFASRFVEALKESEAAHRAARERLQKGG